MTTRMRSGRSGWGDVLSSSCSVMRSSYASTVVPAASVPSLPTTPAPRCCMVLNSASLSAGSCPHSCTTQQGEKHHYG